MYAIPESCISFRGTDGGDIVREAHANHDAWVELVDKIIRVSNI